MTDIFFVKLTYVCPVRNHNEIARPHNCAGTDTKRKEPLA